MSPDRVREIAIRFAGVHRYWESSPHSNLAETIEQAINQALSEAPSGWVKCSERLPEPGHYVIGHWNGLSADAGTDFCITHYDEGVWWNPEDVDDDWCAPTHWMPLPLPPLSAAAKVGE